MLDDFESWEEHTDLLERGNYVGLVAYCEAEVARKPGDLHAMERLGEAYVLNGEYEKAIDAMEPCHREYPDICAFPNIILDALFAMGQTENDFRWSARPAILRLSSKVADICYNFLRRKRKPRLIGELYVELLINAYLMFTEEELMQLLQSDPRFLVEDERVRRKPIA